MWYFDVRFSERARMNSQWCFSMRTGVAKSDKYRQTLFVETREVIVYLQSSVKLP